MKSEKQINMNYNEFLNRVIEEGIEAVKTDYIKPEDKNCLDGSIAGFEACRDKLPDQLVEIWQKASDDMNDAFHEQEDNYWWFRCYEAEVEWVCNVVTAMLMNEGQTTPLLSWLPTANGMMKAASIIGVAQVDV
jgi:hypothetical protein